MLQRINDLFFYSYFTLNIESHILHTTLQMYLFNYRFFLFVRFEYNIVNDIWFNLEDIVSLIL